MSRSYDDGYAAYDDEGRGWVRRVAAGLAVVAIVAFLGNSYLRSGDDPPPIAAAATSPGSASTDGTLLPLDDAPDDATEAGEATPSTIEQPAVPAPPVDVAAPQVDAASAAAPIAVPAETAGTPATTAPSSVAPEQGASGSVGYAIGPDGAPLPVLVVYGPQTVTLSGAVPSDAARELLLALAAANAQRPVNVVDDLDVVESVPVGVGIRVIELDSPRFADGEAEVTLAHAAQFDRVVGVLEAMPHVSVLVIGHADQRGSADRNWELSDARARAAVAYLTDAGIEPSRLSSRAAGETDLLTLDDDDASLALNRRTEFVFYGVLAG